MKTSNGHGIVIFFVVTIFQISCTTNGINRQDSDISTIQSSSISDGADDSALIATDLISAMMQIQGFDPWSLTVQLSPTSSSFGIAVQETLGDSGYGIQNVNSDVGKYFVSYNKSFLSTDRGDEESYQITIAELSIERRYQRIDDILFPSSPIYIKGVSPSHIRINDDIYRKRGGQTSFPSGVLFVNEFGKLVGYDTPTVVSVNSSKSASNSSVSHEYFLILARANLFRYDRIENNTNINSYLPLKQTTLRFPSSNPEILGEANKNAINKLVALFNSSHSAFSITGCSHGKSLLWDGTEGLALERQMRVKEELLIAGIDSNLIHENGCFRTAFGDSLPKQSVILTLRQSLASIN